MPDFRIDGPELKEKSPDVGPGSKFNPDKRIEVGSGEVGRASAETAYNPDSRVLTEDEPRENKEKCDRGGAAAEKLGDMEAKSPESLNNLADAYLDDLKSRSPVPETLADVKIDPKGLRVVNPEETKELRTEFAGNKNKLIDDWEKKTGRDWPRYKEDVCITNKNGETVVIRYAGNRYDAHHIRPLSLGGKNTADNITPMDVRDHRGVHENGGTCDKLTAALKEA